jgi:ribosomal protein S18 acetylase RimI-like enzyme
VSTAPPHADVYVAAFVARCKAMRPVGRPAVDEPGVLGLLPSDEHPSIRLLVTDDRAHEVLAGLLPVSRAGMVNVFAGAVRCADLLDGLAAWRPEAATALVLRDVGTVPALPLPDGLRLRPVRRSPDDGAGGVPLEDAVAAALRADPSIDDPPRAFAGYLRSLPATTRLFAAIDGRGVVRATSGYAVFGDAADVLFVNTDPDWRGRGIGLAMTAAALRAARDHGARSACLDATDAGLSIYRRLGFEVVTPTTRFFAQSPSTS